MPLDDEYQKALAVLPESILSAKDALFDYAQKNAGDPHPYKQMEAVMEYGLQRIDSKRKDYAMAARIILYDLHEILRVSAKEAIGRLEAHYRKQNILPADAVDDHSFHIRKIIVMGEEGGMDMTSERMAFDRLQYLAMEAASMRLHTILQPRSSE